MKSPTQIKQEAAKAALDKAAADKKAAEAKKETDAKFQNDIMNNADNSATESERNSATNDDYNTGYNNSVRTMLNDLDSTRSLMVTNVLDAVIPGNYMGMSSSGAGTGSLHDVVSPSIESRGYMIIETPPFLNMYATSADPFTRQQLLPILKLMSGGMIKSTPRIEDDTKLVNFTHQMHDVYKFIAKILISQSSLAFLSHSLISLPQPPTIASTIVENMTSAIADKKMTNRVLHNLDAGSGEFTLEHNELSFDQVKTFYDMMNAWIYHSSKNALIKIPPEAFFPATIIHSCPIWQIMTKQDGVTVNRLYRYTGCIPGVPVYEENSSFTEGKVNKISCPWSFNWCDFKSLSLMLLFNITVRLQKIEIEKSDKFLDLRDAMGMDTSKKYYDAHFDDFCLAIVPVARYDENVIEDVLVLCTEKEWIDQMGKYNNLVTLQHELDEFSKLVTGEKPIVNKNNNSFYDPLPEDELSWSSAFNDEAAGIEAMNAYNTAQAKKEADAKAKEAGIKEVHQTVTNTKAALGQRANGTYVSNKLNAESVQHVKAAQPLSPEKDATAGPVIGSPFSNALADSIKDNVKAEKDGTLPTTETVTQQIGTFGGANTPKPPSQPVGTGSTTKPNEVPGTDSKNVKKIIDEIKPTQAGGQTTTTTTTPTGSGTQNTDKTNVPKPATSTPPTSTQTPATSTPKPPSQPVGTGSVQTPTTAKPPATSTPMPTTQPVGTGSLPPTNVKPPATSMPKPSTQPVGTGSIETPEKPTTVPPSETKHPPKTDAAHGPTNSGDMYSGHKITPGERAAYNKYIAAHPDEAHDRIQDVLDKALDNERDHRFDNKTNKEIVDMVNADIKAKEAAEKAKDESSKYISEPQKNLYETYDGSGYYNGRPINDKEKAVIRRYKSQPGMNILPSDQEIINIFANGAPDPNSKNYEAAKKEQEQENKEGIPF